MRVHWRVLACALLVSGIGLMAQTARIKGLIQTEDGTPVAGSNVLVVRTRTPPFNSALVTAQDGTFDAPGLPAGTYRICPDIPSSQYLSPCTWYDPNAIVTVQDGQEVDGVSITLHQGSTITVVVKDPGGLAQAKHNGNDPPQFLFIAVKGPKKIPYPLVGGIQNGSSTTYQMVVPTDTPLKLIVFPVGLAATEDAAGEVPDTGKGYDFSQARRLAQFSSGPGTLPTFQFTISNKHN